MDLQELLDLIARWADLTDAERTQLAGGLNLAERSEDELAQIEAALNTVVDEILDGDRDDTALEALGWIADTTEAITAERDAREAADAERDAQADELVRRIRGSQDAGDGDGGEGADGDGENSDGEGGEGDGDSDGGEAQGAEGAQEREPVAAAATRVTRVAARRPAATRPRPTATVEPAPLVASANVPGVSAGGVLSDTRALGTALLSTWESMAGLSVGPGMRVPVAGRNVLRQFPDELTLDGSVRSNMEKINRYTSTPAVTAAGGLCAPTAVRYDLPGVGVDDRPVRDSLTRFGADRGGVRVLDPPVLEDLDGAIGVWTEANDRNPGSDGPSTKPCLVVDCGDEREVIVEAITNCLEFKNFSARFFPEQVDRYVQLAGVAQARKAEVELLTAIAAGSTHVSVGQGLSATRDILAGIDRIVAARRSRFRLSQSVPLRRLAPMWERDMIRADLARELPGSTAERLAMADAQIDEFFAVRNINNTYILDGEAGQMFGAQADGPAHGWPSTIVSYIFQDGAWLFLDGGELNLGIVRDSGLNAANKFQMWSETFEAAIFVGIWSDRVVHDVCPSGATSGALDFDPCTTGS